MACERDDCARPANPLARKGMNRLLRSDPPDLPKRPKRRGWKLGVLGALIAVYAGGIAVVSRPGTIRIPLVPARISVSIVPWKMDVPIRPLPSPHMTEPVATVIPPPRLVIDRH
ncbi:hypothetical protein AA0472_1699 [Acetobacter estunensis NRIC 0472]|uniref:Uncharacterized protein n=1 Tax=Acetobacter estunensis TaxID=104097 RepID=A0A967B6B9_9PROT|nr:hypothetical protein [Acetobacter estunensis]NHO53698.1 hypothetical protein [Acetobacter estunensis]GBQ25258.1 hypothetical protein AA0472_1699 [Acetobacter estunensis NRIC 0472]